MTVPDGLAPKKVARCPKCRSATLVLHEDHIEAGSTDPGEQVIIGKHVVPSSDFWYEAGDPLRVFFQCCDCGHEWKSKWWVR